MSYGYFEHKTKKWVWRYLFRGQWRLFLHYFFYVDDILIRRYL